MSKKAPQKTQPAGGGKKSGKGAKPETTATSTIALNKKAKHDYFIDERFEAGIVLQGWEVKSLRDGRVQLRDAYVLLKNSEAFLFGAHITPLNSASTHVNPETTRTRKLLLNRSELAKLIGQVERKGFALIATAMYWKRGRAKLEIALARGKQEHDKRDTIKERDWNRDRRRLLKTTSR